MLRDRLDGDRWRWWSLLAGIVLTGLSTLAALAVALLAGADGAALATLALAVELFIACVAGSGIIEGLSGRAIAGGLSRQPLPDDRNQRRAAERSAAEQARRDRRTVRAGLVALPLLIGFVTLLIVG